MRQSYHFSQAPNHGERKERKRQAEKYGQTDRQNIDQREVVGNFCDSFFIMEIGEILFSNLRVLIKLSLYKNNCMNFRISILIPCPF